MVGVSIQLSLFSSYDCVVFLHLISLPSKVKLIGYCKYTSFDWVLYMISVFHKKPHTCFHPNFDRFVPSG